MLKVRLGVSGYYNGWVGMDWDGTGNGFAWKWHGNRYQWRLRMGWKMNTMAAPRKVELWAKIKDTKYDMEDTIIPCRGAIAMGS